MMDAISTRSDCTRNNVSRLNAKLLNLTMNFDAKTLDLQE